MSYAVDAELAPWLPGIPDLDVGDPRKAGEIERALAARRPEPDLAGLTVEDHEVPGRHGAPSVPVRVYRPRQGSGRLPAVLLMHSGGFVTGGLHTEHAGAAAIAESVAAVVVSVGYRLAPEHPHPAAVGDCYAALLWLAETADDLGVDPAGITVSGQNAGGGPAAAVALLARDCGGPALAFQALGAPELDDRLGAESMRSCVDTPVRYRGHAEQSWAAYPGDEAGGPRVSSYAAPARATDLTRLPPAYVTVSQFDPFRDEAWEYARRLAQANVPVELHLYPGTFHGATLVSGAAVSRRMTADLVDALRRALAVAPASAGLP
ncbi:alpha/beta hydrolase fold domain-containing protein [Amycolatopsis sp. NPDC049253]|uniref:alpha/beta hydrolase fold domain-containing protein n=1 Tax=Amycolatopsis sp. NPDC049253 TaxID=3155274 RepID=UPI00343ED1B7